MDNSLLNLVVAKFDIWPVVDGVECGFIVQEFDGELFSTSVHKPYRRSNSWWRDDKDFDCECGYFEPRVWLEVAEDWKVAMITKDMFLQAKEAE